MTKELWRTWKWLCSTPDCCENPGCSCTTPLTILLASLVAATVVQLVCSLLLILGAMIEVRALLLPWLISDLHLTVIFTLIFLFLTFLSFIVDLLVALFFPVVAGLIVGLWCYNWKNGLDLFLSFGEKKNVITQEIQGTVYNLVPAKDA